MQPCTLTNRKMCHQLPASKQAVKGSGDVLKAAHRDMLKKGVPEGLRLRYDADEDAGVAAVSITRPMSSPFAGQHKKGPQDKLLEAADYYTERTRIQGRKLRDLHVTPNAASATNASPQLVHPSLLQHLGYSVNPTTHITPALRDPDALRRVNTRRGAKHGKAGLHYHP
jgi:hypothetical protein